jgi:hypothetical protein
MQLCAIKNAYAAQNAVMCHKKRKYGTKIVKMASVNYFTKGKAV